MAKTFLTAEWRKLVMAQYAVEPVVLTPWLPQGVELDLYGQGQVCFVSLVGFLFDKVRIFAGGVGMPPPFHTRFDEVNLRFYVRRVMPDGTYRRGVVFVSEIVAKPAITWVARALYGEAYRTAATRHVWREGEAGLDVSYSWKVPGRGLSTAGGGPWQHLAVQASGTAEEIQAGSLEEFITEHYWGYTQHTGLIKRQGATGEYGVEHPRWQCYPVRAAQVSADFGALYGRAFAGLTEREPEHVLLAEGSAVAIRGGGRVGVSSK